MATLTTRKDSKYIQIRFYNPLLRRSDIAPTAYLKDDKKHWKLAEAYLDVFEKNLEDLKIQLKHGNIIPKELDFNDGYTQFKDSKVNIKQGTLTVYDVAVNDHFLIACGNKPLKEYTEADYARLIRHFRKIQVGQKKDELGKLRQGLSITTQAIYLRHLHCIWSYFVKKNWVRENIIQKIKAPKKKVKTIPKDDLEVILDHFKNTNIKHYHTVRLLLNTGWRVSTLLAQRWEKINLNDDFFTAYNVKASQEFNFPLHKQLRELFLEMGVKRKGPLVDFACYDSIRNFWIDGLEKLLKPDDGSEPKIRARYTLHQLRKSFNSMLANNYFDAKDLMVLLDHSDYKITKESYTEFDLKRIKKDIDKTIDFPR